MSKAEEMALMAYPSTPNWNERITRIYRGGFIKGYHQAEKDLELTWEDLALIEKICKNFMKENDTPMNDMEFFEEVLKRYKIERKK